MKPMNSQRGVGLMEILIALFVIAIGVLGTITLHTRASQAELESYQRVQAMIMLEDMVSRMSANRSSRSCYDISGQYGLNHLGTDSNAAGTDLTTCDAIAGSDLVDWDSTLNGQDVTEGGNGIGAMIGARGCIERLAERQYRVSVAWQGMQATAAPDGTLTCGANAYGDENLRRVVTRIVDFADLGT